MKKRAVFIDRDGTINEEVGHLGQVERMTILPNSASAIRLLNESGYKVVVITNQAGVARGYFDENTVKKVNDHLKVELARNGATVDAFYYCPHHPDFGDEDYRQNCDCRKPEPGMLIKAAIDHDIDLSFSFMIGDTIKDMVAGSRAGCKTILVYTGHGEKEAENITEHNKPSFIADDLLDAVQWIIDLEKE